MPNIASKQTIYLRTEERYKTSNLAVAREGIYLLFYEFSEFFDEKQLFNAGSKITKIADRNGRHIGCPNGTQGWSSLPTSGVFLSKSFTIFANEPAGLLPWKHDLPLFNKRLIIAYAQQTCLASPVPSHLPGAIKCNTSNLELWKGKTKVGKQGVCSLYLFETTK